MIVTIVMVPLGFQWHNNEECTWMHIDALKFIRVGLVEWGKMPILSKNGYNCEVFGAGYEVNILF